MLFLISSVICSVTVGVLFKIARSNDSNSTQIVTSNYLFALFFSLVFFRPDFASVDTTVPWKIYIALGFLLPIVFLILIASIQHNGIVTTDAAQRLALFIPILAAWLLFDESFNSLKIAAFFVALPALLLILAKPSPKDKSNWMYASLVLLGFGVIDILFKKIAMYTSLPFTTSLALVFSIALLFMILYVGYSMVFKGEQLHPKSIAFGALVGVFNFGNIFFYLKAHQEFSENPSTVFAGMNLGVIVLGSLVGTLVFNEKLSKINYLGLVLALVAIVLIVFSQLA